MIAATAWLAAIATAVAALELMRVHRAFESGGVFRWATLRRDFAGAPRFVRAVADVLFGARGTWALLVVQLAAAIALPLVAHPAPAFVALGCALAIAIRFRGSYNGGSDAMLVVVLLGLGIARAGWPRVGLAYIAAQLVLSYVLAGFAKLRDPRWRDGSAFEVLAALPAYAVPPAIARLLARPAIGRAAAYATLAFECGFPLALLDPRVATVMLAIGAGFHLANAIAFGLNRFLWTWLAAYPALWFWAILAR